MPAGHAPARRRAAPDGGVWFSAQRTASRPGRSETDESTEIPLGDGSAPHGVIQGPDTQRGHRRRAQRDRPRRPARPRSGLPPACVGAATNLNTASSTTRRSLVHRPGRRLREARPKTGASASRTRRSARARTGSARRRGRGLLRSLAGTHIARIDRAAGESTVIRAADGQSGSTPRLEGHEREDLGQRVERGQGRPVRPGDPEVARVARPGPAQIYAVYVDDEDMVWLTDFGRAAWRFDPGDREVHPRPLRERSERAAAPRPARGGLGRESGSDRLVVVRG